MAIPAIELAEVRCLSMRALFRRLVQDVGSRDHIRVVRVIEERARVKPLGTLRSAAMLGDAQQDKLLKALLELVGRVPSESEGRKAMIERRVRRLSALLKRDLAQALGKELLCSRRRGLREVAYRCFSRHGLPEALADRMRQNLVSLKGSELPNAFLASPEAPRWLAPDHVLRNAKEDYLRMRIIVAFLMIRPDAVWPLADTYPIAFMWAIGRLGKNNAKLGRAAKRLYRKHQNHPGFLSFYAWTLGKLGLAQELKRLRKAVGQELKTLPSELHFVPF